VQRDDWPLEDPKGKPVERVREIRDDVKARVAELIADEGWSKHRDG
jgi:arsenate reductase